MLGNETGAEVAGTLDPSNGGGGGGGGYGSDGPNGGPIEGGESSDVLHPDLPFVWTSPPWWIIAFWCVLGGMWFMFLLLARVCFST